MSGFVRGRIFYDADCPMCRAMMRRFEKTFTSRGFGFAPLQLELKPGTRPNEMRVRTADGSEFGCAEAVVFLAGFVWWGQPLRWLAKLPGSKFVLRRIYREIAERRTCDGGVCRLPEAKA
jgi:predicted DCC family thiol-disulfide oxidoreductase YuxK